ncbi:autotransporter domain-containing protein [Sphingomonas sp. UNC305MFCol5.2]|uniref:autotransporter domain-containing protein n=1 Tax=Sphingomonas sp. UNC305MFCol5.2 TaxID=1449076 RepID=UPI000567F2F0|nr:autotransporter domain-containing protein [Sphingomonas sp. UNC305MFCol5.2]
MSYRRAFVPPPRLATALLATTVLAGIAAPAHAQSVTWNGSASTDFDDPANWNENRAPAPADTIIVNNDASSSNAPTEAGDKSVYRVLVGTAGNSNAVLNVDGSLFFSGSSDGRPLDTIGANGGAGTVNVTGAWRSVGTVAGVGSGSRGVLSAASGGRIETGNLSLGIAGGEGQLNLDIASTVLSGDVRLGDADSGVGNVMALAAQWDMDDLTVNTGRLQAYLGELTADTVRINHSGPDDRIAELDVGGTATVLTVQVGGESGPTGQETGVTGRGILNISGTLITSQAFVPSVIGFGAGSDGQVTMSGGTWNSAYAVMAGLLGATGTLRMSDFSDLDATQVVIGARGGAATLSVFTGSRITAGDLIIGMTGGSGSAAFDLVSGASLSGSLHVGGYFGAGQQGSLTISGGSAVTAAASQSTIGIGAGSVGSVLVSGQMSALRFGDTALIGAIGGTGSVALADQAVFSVAGNLMVGGFGGVGTDNPDGLASNGAVSLDRSTLETGGEVVLGSAGATGSIDLANQSAWTAAGGVALGSEYGTGRTTVDSGSTVTIGGNLGVGGAMAIDPGDQSLLLDAGAGSLRVAGGGTVRASNPDARTGIGVGLGSDGEVVVTGAGSSLTVDGQAYAGAFGGTGIIEVIDSGTLTFSGIALIGYRAAGIPGSSTFGSLTASTAVINSVGVSVGDGAAGAVSLGNGALWGNAGSLDLGIDAGSAEATVTSGSELASKGLLRIGVGNGAEGALGVDGPGTRWSQTGAIVLGESGNGRIKLTGGATAVVHLTDQAFTLGDAGQGSLIIDGAGTTFAQTHGNFTLGTNGGTGGIAAHNGGVLTGTGGITIGAGANAAGALEADGAGSVVRLDGAGIFGTAGGSGFVRVLAGGAIELGSDQAVTRFGEGVGSTGEIAASGGGQVTLHGQVAFGGEAPGGSAFGSVDGAGSQFAVLGGLFDMTAGTIEVTNSGRLLTGSGANIGSLGDAPSRVTLSGTGSSWTSGSDTYIGGRIAGPDFLPGQGVVELLGGANASFGRLHIASEGGTGSLLVDMDSSVGAGTYAQGSGGILTIGLDPNTAGRAGRIDSDGNSFVLADGTHIAFVKQVAGRYHIGDRYEILLSRFAPITRGSIIFEGLARQSLFVGLVPVFESIGQGEALYLDVAQLASFISVAGTPNQAAVAAAVDGPANAASIKAAILDLQTESEAQGAFDALSGEIYPGVLTALVEDSRLPRMAALNRLTEAEGGAGAWMQAIGNWGATGGNGNAATLERDTKGVLIGTDLALGESGLRAGLAGGYSNGNFGIDARASHADVKSYHLLGYVGGGFGNVQLRAGAAYSWSKIDAARSVTFPGFADNLRGRYDARTLQGFGELGYRVPLGTGWVEPFAGVSSVRVQADAFTEGGGAALTVARHSRTTTASTLGFKGATAITGPIVAGFTLGWQHRFDATDSLSEMRLAGSAPFTIAGAPLAKDAGLAEISLGWRVAPGTSVAIRYSGALGTKTSDNGAKASLSIAF